MDLDEPSGMDCRNIQLAYRTFKIGVGIAYIYNLILKAILQEKDNHKKRKVCTFISKYDKKYL